MNFTWTSEQDGWLAELWEEGKTLAEIAEIMGRTTAAVAKHVRGLSLSFRHPRGGGRPTPATPSRLLALRALGHSQQECADLMGLTVGQVAGQLHRLRKQGVVKISHSYKQNSRSRPREPRRNVVVPQPAAPALPKHWTDRKREKNFTRWGSPRE